MCCLSLNAHYVNGRANLMSFNICKFNKCKINTHHDANLKKAGVETYKLEQRKGSSLSPLSVWRTTEIKQTNYPKAQSNWSLSAVGVYPWLAQQQRHFESSSAFNTT